MWVLGINTTGIVQWGTQSGKYTWNTTTTPYTYNVNQVRDGLIAQRHS